MKIIKSKDHHPAGGEQCRAFKIQNPKERIHGKGRHPLVLPVVFFFFFKFFFKCVYIYIYTFEVSMSASSPAVVPNLEGACYTCTMMRGVTSQWSL